ncbi:MAG TPA: hypothetical protein VKB87_07065 [Myxococcaceae bacterium]|nr:hypothetical protein [Myxococcaceae bacterium]
MSDIRVSMREFRFLEEKRKLAALSQAEEQRWIELGQMLGIFEANPHPPAPEAQQPQGYYAQDGNWYPRAGSFPAQAYPQSADGEVGAETYAADDSQMGELSRFIDSPAEGYAAHSNSMPSGSDQPAPGEHPGFSPTPFASAVYAAPAPALDPTRAEPSAPFFQDGLTTRSSPEQLNGVSEPNPDEVMEVDPNDVFLVEQGESERASPGADHSGPAQAVAASASPEHSAADGNAVGQSDATLPLTQSFEWIPASPPPQNAIPLEAEKPEIVQTNAIGEPPPVDEASASDSPVIDLLDSDAMQAEIGTSSWGEQIPQPETVAAAETGVGDASSDAERLEVEPIAQWTREAEASAPPAGSEEPEPIATEGPPEVAESFPSNPSSAPPTSDVSSSASGSSSFQFVPATNSQAQEQATPVQMHTSAAETEIAPQADDAPSSPPLNAADVQPSGWRDSPSANMPSVLSSEASQPSVVVSAQFGDGKDLLSSSFVQGERRVVIHLLDGQVKRGVLRDVDLMASHIPLDSSTGTLDNIPLDRIKAIFFMVAPGSQKPVLQGQRIRLTFQDGREVIGFSTDYKTSDAGFFVTPADARTNTERIYVLRWSISSIDEQ